MNKEREEKDKWSYRDFKEYIDQCIWESEQIIKTKLNIGDKVRYTNKENENLYGAIGIIVGFKVGEKSGRVLATVTYDGKSAYNLYADYLKRESGFLH